MKPATATTIAAVSFAIAALSFAFAIGAKAGEADARHDTTCEVGGR